MIAYIYLFGLILLWTLNPFIKKLLMNKFNSEEYFFINHVVVSIFMLIYFFYSYSKNKINYKCVTQLSKFSKKEVSILFLGGLFSVLSSRLLPYIISMKNDISYLISNVQPVVIVLTAFIGYMFFEENLTQKKGLGIILVASGLIIINSK